MGVFGGRGGFDVQAPRAGRLLLDGDARLPRRVAMAANVHLGEGAHVPDAHHLHREVAEEVDELKRPGTHVEHEQVRRQNRRQDVFHDAHLNAHGFTLTKTIFLLMAKNGVNKDICRAVEPMILNHFFTPEAP